MSPESATRLRMVCLDTIRYMSTAKWRRIDESDIFCVDMAAMLIARSSGALWSRGCPGSPLCLTVPSLIHRGYQHTTAISSRPTCCLFNLLDQLASPRPMFRHLSHSAVATAVEHVLRDISFKFQALAMIIQL